MASQPLQAPTEWVGVSSSGRVYMIVSCVLICLSFVAVGLRVWARLRQYKTLFADDYFSIISQVFAFVLMALAINFSTTCGMGWHVTQLPPLQVERFFKFFYVAELTYSLVSPFYKLAVLFLYKRIFGHINLFNIAVWIMSGLSVGWGLGAVFSTIFQCTPIQKAWNAALPGHCVNTQAYILGNGVGNLVIDVLILFMPVPVVWGLHLTVSKKLALTGMFFLGSVVCVASIIRVTTLTHIDLTDPTYNLVNVAIWSEVEPALGIISACLPTLRQFFWQKISNTYSSRRYGSRGYQVSGGKSQVDNVEKSNTAVALTGWKTADTYAEIKESTSGSRTPSQRDPEYNGAIAGSNDGYIGKLSHEEHDDKSIFVKTEFSVRHDPW